MYSSVASSSEQHPPAPEQAVTSVLGSPTVATDNGNSQGSFSKGDTAGGNVDSAASEVPTSLSTAATSGGGSGEEVAAAPDATPTAEAVPTEAAELSGTAC